MGFNCKFLEKGDIEKISEKIRKNSLTIFKKTGTIKRLAEMSEWFKEHDWKSCDGGDSSGGSNPLLCASKNLS